MAAPRCAAAGGCPCRAGARGEGEGGGARRAQGGGVELDEPRVSHLRPRLEGECDAVAGGRLGVGGVSEQATRSSGGQDDVAAALVQRYGIPTFSIKGEDDETYYGHIGSALDHNPQIPMDDGAALVTALHRQRAHQLPDCFAGVLQPGDVFVVHLVE